MKREWHNEREARQRPPIALYRPPHKRADSYSPPRQRRTDGGSSQLVLSDRENQSGRQRNHGNSPGQSAGDMTSQNAVTVSCHQESPLKAGNSVSGLMEDGGSLTEGCHDRTRGDSHQERGCNSRPAALYYPPHRRKILAENSDTPYPRKLEKNGVLLRRGEFHLEVEVQPNQWWQGIVKVS